MRIMTLEEADRYASQTNFCEYCKQDILSSCAGCPYSDYIMLSKQLIKNQLKYRWHDLRNDPTDLPRDGELVETVFVPARLPIHAINYRYGHEYGSEGFNKRTDATVIAWREVEPYKEKE